MGSVCDFIEDTFREIGRIFRDIAETVANFVMDLINGLIEAIVYVFVWIGDHLVEVLVGISLILIIIYFPYVLGYIEGVIAAVPTSIAEVSLYISLYSEALGNFLIYIHFSTIMAIHSLAYMVSEDYRLMMSKIWTQIAQVSKQLGLGAAFLSLALHNARSVVLDVSSRIGMKYDLAELAWLQEFNGFLSNFAKDTKRYMNEPGLVFWDIDQWIIKKQIDRGGGYAQVIWTSIETGIKGLKEMFEEVTEFKTGLETLVGYMPSFIRKEIQPELDKVTRYVDDFVDKHYQPSMDLLDNSIRILQGRQQTTVKSIDGIVNRLIRPADYLHEIDSLPDDARFEQEKSLAEITTRDSRADANETIEATNQTWLGLMKVRKALAVPVDKVAWDIPEAPNPGRPALATILPRLTWNVGDF